MFGALAMVLGGLFPPVGAFFSTLPDCVLGGFFDNLPVVLGKVFAGNMVAGVFVVGLIMELCLPRDPTRYETRPAEKQ